MEMLREVGYCHGVENYSRHLSGRKPGENPPTLMDYLPKDALVILDESHVTAPQVRGMYPGDRSRKEALVEYGFRLPSAFDNRPLTFAEFTAPRPDPLRLRDAGALRAGGRARAASVAEQIIRPTGLMDPSSRSGPCRGRWTISWARCGPGGARRAGAHHHAHQAHGRGPHRVLPANGLRVRYLHSDIDTLERVAILRDLRLGKFDILIGINLLREGLDLPEVSLVAILDADKEGFLRSAASLIQTIGRAARHVNGEVIMYADSTGSMKAASRRPSGAA